MILTAVSLKVLRKLHEIFFGPYEWPVMPRENDADKASYAISDLLVSDKPCMIARFGSTELACLTNYLSLHSRNHDAWRYVKGEIPDWWWNKRIMNQMEQCGGFFPLSKENLSGFCALLSDDIRYLDYLGSWVPDECYIRDMIENVPKTRLLNLEPYWSKNPWSRVLAGKKILVVHPFAELIEKQYVENRTKLFNDSRVLPLFELQTLKAVQSIGGVDNGFADWFEALRWMEDEIDKRDYDICLIGCGAYGFALAAHVKRQGKKAVHLGGALQLLFGIRGKRWNNPGYGFREFGKRNSYHDLFNDYWVYPDKQDRPKDARNVENGCYW